MTARDPVPSRPASPRPRDWSAWKSTVVRILRRDYADLVPDIGEDDVHWDTWRRYFDEGSAPRRAVDRAFERL